MAKHSADGARAFSWIVWLVMIVVILIVLALTFRSVWWVEEGAPVPRGTAIELTRAWHL